MKINIEFTAMAIGAGAYAATKAGLPFYVGAIVGGALSLGFDIWDHLGQQKPKKPTP